MSKPNQNQLLTDLHAHSLYSGWSNKEGITHSPADLVTYIHDQRQEKLAAGVSTERVLGGIALTGHDTLQGVSEAIEAGKRLDVVVSPGVEVTSKATARGGFKFGPHIVVLLPIEVAHELEVMEARGIKDSLLQRADRKPAYIIKRAHELGGVAILPHLKPLGDQVSVSYKKAKKLATHEEPIKRPDAMEVGVRSDPYSFAAFYEMAKELGLAGIGSSDAHDFDDIGSMATRMTDLPANPTGDDVLDAIRDGRTEAVRLRDPTKKDVRSSIWPIIAGQLPDFVTKKKPTEPVAA